jgi:hypothetical protein
MSFGKSLSLCLAALGVLLLATPSAEARERQPVKAQSCGNLTFASGKTYQLVAGKTSCEEAAALIQRWWGIHEDRGSFEYVEIDGWHCGTGPGGLPICGKGDQGTSLVGAGRDVSGMYFGTIPERPRLHISRAVAKNFARRALIASYAGEWRGATRRRLRCSRRFSQVTFRCSSVWRSGPLGLRTVMRVKILPPRGGAQVRVTGQTVSIRRSESVGPVLFSRATGEVVKPKVPADR